MTTTTVSSKPTHVAFFPEIPGARIEFDAAKGYEEPVAALIKQYPNAGIPKVTPLVVGTAIQIVEEAPVAEPAVPPVLAVVPENESDVDAAKRIGTSTWGDLKTDATAKARIEAMHGKLSAAGVDIDPSKQLFATGTRMAEVGYRNQSERKAEHDKMMPIGQAIEALVETVRAEQRREVRISARELSQRVDMNGKLTIGGYTAEEQAVRGILGRIESPALSYVFGLRDRIADAAIAMKRDGADVEAIRDLQIRDKRRLAGTIAHELWQAGDASFVLRTRMLNGVPNAYAAVSPRYEPADAPEVLAQIAKALPRDAKGTWSYDPSTTSWELRAELWTPTPVALQAVGEPFRGYVSFRSKDNGTGSLKGGGGIEILACLNASTYVADATEVNRRHIGAIVAEATLMVEHAKRSIEVLSDAWGVARDTEVALPSELESLAGLPISKVIEGFWWGELTDRKRELAGVLPGRTKDHVLALTERFESERRDSTRLVKADFAQAWTREIQKFPADVRRDAESAIASWVVDKRPMCFDADRVSLAD